MVVSTMYPRVKRVRRGARIYEYLQLVDRAAPMRGRAQLTHGEVIAALVANRLSAPSPLYDVAGWASSAALAELFDIPAMLLNDDRLGRALEALAPVAEHVRGELALAAAHRGGADLSRLHLDLTAVRFAGAYEDSSLVQKGWAADRSIARQVRTLQASNPQGVAVYLRPHTGSRSELPCFAEALDRLRELAPPGLVVVADSGLGYLAHLCAADRAGLRFVVPLRADTGWAHAFTSDVGALDRLADLDYCSARQQRLPPVDRTVWRGLLRPFAVTDPDTGTHHDLHVAYIWSSEEATSVADGRARALQRAEAALAKVRNGLGPPHRDLRRRRHRRWGRPQGLAARDGPGRGRGREGQAAGAAQPDHQRGHHRRDRARPGDDQADPPRAGPPGPAASRALRRLRLPLGRAGRRRRL